MRRSPFHPELRWASILPKGVARPWSVPWFRRLLPKALGLRPTAATKVELSAGGALWYYAPAGQQQAPAVLWIHGGGLLFGAARQDEALCRRIASTLGVAVAAVEYRLPPAHPFPTPLQDCQDALDWLAQRPEVDPRRIAVAGASAGGGLAAALSQRCLHRGDTPPVFQLLVYPMLDDRTSYRTDIDDAALRMWDRQSNAMGWSAYLHGVDLATAPDYAVPARVSDLRALPPAWIGVGTCDLFFAEGTTYAERLRAAGVECELEVVQGAYHGFDQVEPRAPVSRRFVASQISALARGLGLGPNS